MLLSIQTSSLFTGTDVSYPENPQSLLIVFMSQLHFSIFAPHSSQVVYLLKVHLGGLIEYGPSLHDTAIVGYCRQLHNYIIIRWMYYILKRYNVPKMSCSGTFFDVLHRPAAHFPHRIWQKRPKESEASRLPSLDPPSALPRCRC